MVWLRATRPRRTLVRMVSAVAVQTKALGSMLWTCMYFSMEEIRSGTEWNTPRRSALPLRSRNHRSINRPWWAVSSGCRGWVCVSDSVEVAGDAGDDAGVAGDFGVPASGLGVLAQLGDVGEVGLQGGDEFRAGGEVVALLADVGVGAGFGDEVARAVAMRDTGFEHLCA